jgi:hypothetical protein
MPHRSYLVADERGGNMDLRFSQGRVYALRLLDPMTQNREEAQRWRELVGGLDEDGIYRFLEGRQLKPEDAKRLELLKQAKAVGDRCTELGKQIPLVHEDIHKAYDELRDLTAKVEELSLHQLHLA